MQALFVSSVPICTPQLLTPEQQEAAVKVGKEKRSEAHRCGWSNSSLLQHRHTIT